MRLGDIERWLWWIKTIFIFCFVNAWPGIGLNVTMTKDRFEWCTVCFKTILHVPIKVMHAKSMLEYARMKGFKFFKENIFCFCNRLKFTWRGNGWKNVYMLEKCMSNHPKTWNVRMMHVKTSHKMGCISERFMSKHVTRYNEWYMLKHPRRNDFNPSHKIGCQNGLCKKHPRRWSGYENV